MVSIISGEPLAARAMAPSVDSSLGAKLLPGVLSVTAGSVDVISFLGLGGLFAAQFRAPKDAFGVEPDERVDAEDQEAEHRDAIAAELLPGDSPEAGRLIRECDILGDSGRQGCRGGRHLSRIRGSPQV